MIHKLLPWPHLVRVLTDCGHAVRLIHLGFVKAYVKSNKNDFRDAEAIAEAVTRPTMRFVAIKTVVQQELQASGCKVLSDSDGVNRSDRHLESLAYPLAVETAVCDKAQSARISIEARGSCLVKAGYLFATFLHFKLNSALHAGQTIHG